MALIRFRIAAQDLEHDGNTLFGLFTRTRAVRRSIVEAGQDTSLPNFGRPQKK